MDRVIVYPAQVIADTDTLIAQRNTERAIGQAVAMSMGGPGPFASGLAATCSGSDMVVNVGSGQINEGATADSSAYGTLAADSSIIMRQYTAVATSFTLTAATTALTYYIYATVGLNDTGSTMLRYLDAADNTKTLSGEDDTGTAQPTQRAAVATVTISTTTPPANAIALWRIDLPANATSVTQSMISLDNDSLFYPKIPALAPKDSPTFTGTPTAPTPAAGDSSNLLATTAFITNWSAGNLLQSDIYFGPTASAGGYNVLQISVESRTKFLIVELSGGGGGGGGAPTCSSTQGGTGGGGGAGGYCRFLVDVSKIQWPVTATLGAGGRGGQSSSTGMTGNAGGSAAFGSMVVVTGGFGGLVAQGGGVAIIGGAGAGGSVQVTTATGITVLNSATGQSGFSGHVSGVSENYFFGYGGAGGARAPYYAGGWESGSGETGKPGDPGGGGSGSCVAPSGTYKNGGDGGPSWLTVTQYG
ncbi:hypothetical protein AA0242T_2477 [Acetobacter aceti NRIC 0242]|uniref:Glycine-rich domain-containing protein n=1 Tax=Acetobacter aceti NBRC 14818 TaxID=887700 RepID=A0AB33IEF5_ACEAC|nr:hypothetical protein [Acetobacter aceti]TCS35416.1 hypothetical protein EDC15_101214 [Acetobacter aceti NBRC 14818]BCK75196.1 hypothetical protein EMQ_0802 [Acetobacter aceti NBRC 14818]GAN57514.1 hypothetical protein Abac_017_215 [Acetobacter aceti NBRC 14818]GBO81775.1 hypothetical protein AA0242T_2477 [Acetobacter aceti NRIC 0242]